jgi:hypothetical protein
MLYLHIPKTAGTSFRSALCNLFGDNRVRRIEGPYRGFESEAARVMESEFGDLRCVTGHVPLHVWQPYLARLRPFTILRDPVARVFSLYRFLSRASEEALVETGLKPGFTFDEFLASRAPGTYSQVNNGICRMLSGDPRLSDHDTHAFWNARAMERAAEAAFAFLERTEFGLVEEMGETLRLVQQALGIPYAMDEYRENTTQAGAEQTVDNIRRIAALNTADIALYQAARALFRTRIAAPVAKARLTDESGVWQAPLGAVTAVNDIPGRQGFHDYESDGFAWLMTTTMPRLHFMAPVQLRHWPACIVLRIYMIGPSYEPDEIVFRVNGERPPRVIEGRDGNWCTIAVGPLTFDAGPQQLTIEQPYAVPMPFMHPHSGDRRSLGVALATVALRPEPRRPAR